MKSLTWCYRCLRPPLPRSDLKISHCPSQGFILSCVFSGEKEHVGSDIVGAVCSRYVISPHIINERLFTWLHQSHAVQLSAQEKEVIGLVNSWLIVFPIFLQNHHPVHYNVLYTSILFLKYG